MTFRRPHITPARSKASLATPVLGSGIALLTAVVAAAPFLNVDFSAPKSVQRAAPDQVHTNINLFTNPIPFFNIDKTRPSDIAGATAQQQPLNLNLIAVVQSPFAQLDWSRPSAKPVFGTPYSSGAIIDVTQPFAQYDWSKSFKPLPAIARVEGVNLPLTVVIVQTPFAQYDWSKSYFSQPSKPFAQQPNYGSFYPNPIPFAQYDWSKGFDVAGLPSQAVPRNINIYSEVPFYQTDWSKAQKPAVSPPQIQPYNPLILSAVPFFQIDWSKTVFPKSVPAIPPYNNNLYVAVAPAPFAQYDWSKPFFARATAVTVLSVNINLFINSIPFAQYDWAKTIRQQVPPVPLLPLNTGLFPPPLVVKAPFAQYDWTPARFRQVAGLPISQTLLPLILPPTPPIPPFPPIPPGLFAEKVIAVDAASGFPGATPIFQTVLPSNVNVGDPFALLVETGQTLKVNTVYSLFVTKPDGVTYLAVSPAVYVSPLDVFVRQGLFPAFTYTVLIIPGQFVDQHGYWSCFLKSGVYTSQAQQFYIGPPTVLV